MYSFESRIRFSEIDENGYLRATSLVDYLQDCALFHSETVGHGVRRSATPNLRWLLSAWEIQIARMPRFTELVRVSTWATQFKGLFARRNLTLVAVATGEELVRADSQWFMFDSAIGRPVRPPKDETDAYADDLAAGIPSLTMPPLQRVLPTEGEGVGEGAAARLVPVSHDHLDTNHHVNNAQYVRMALAAAMETGCMPDDGSARVRRLDVQYREAARLGDTIAPHVHRLAGGALRDNLDEGELAAVADGVLVTLDSAGTSQDSLAKPGQPFVVVRARW